MYKQYFEKIGTFLGGSENNLFSRFKHSRPGILNFRRVILMGQVNKKKLMFHLPRAYIFLKLIDFLDIVFKYIYFFIYYY